MSQSEKRLCVDGEIMNKKLGLLVFGVLLVISSCLSLTAPIGERTAEAQITEEMIDDIEWMASDTAWKKAHMIVTEELIDAFKDRDFDSIKRLGNIEAKLGLEAKENNDSFNVSSKLKKTQRLNSKCWDYVYMQGYYYSIGDYDNARKYIDLLIEQLDKINEEGKNI